MESLSSQINVSQERMAELIDLISIAKGKEKVALQTEFRERWQVLTDGQRDRLLSVLAAAHYDNLTEVTLGNIRRIIASNWLANDSYVH